MWLASLRRLVAGNSHSRKERRRWAARNRKRVRLRLESLEQRLTPSGPQTAGGYTALTAAVALDTAANTNYVIQITGSFQFNSGGQVSISKLGAGSTLTIEGQNGTNYTLTGNGNRLFDIAKGQTVGLQNLTLTGGAVGGSAAKGGAVYNSGNLSMISVVVAGNQAIGGSGQNAAGGGIYSNGGSLTLVNDLIGRRVKRTFSQTKNLITGIASPPINSTKATGASNKATGGTGGNGQGAGIYVSGGTVKVSHCTIAGNQLSGGVNAQGGGIYVTGATLKLSNDVIGLEFDKTHTITINYSKGTETSKVTSSSVGASNKAAAGSGGSGQGGGLYAAGGSVSATDCTLGDNQLSAGVSAQGGGIYANGVSNLTLKNDVVGRESVRKANYYPPGETSPSQITAHTSSTNTLGSANTATGGSAMGAGLYVSGGVVSVSQGAIAGNQAKGGAGQNAAGGGVYSVGATLGFTNVALTNNSALGGNATGVGAAGGNAQGGQLFISGGQVSFTDSQVTKNGSGAALGGNGGIGGNGGNAQGGGIYAINTSLTLSNGSIVDRDLIQAGKGGSGTAHHLAGGNGGNGQGGGVFASATTIVLNSGSTIFNNNALGGAGAKGGDALSNPANATVNRPGATAGGQGGNGGMAQGGGLYAKGGSVTIAGTNNPSNNTAVSNNQAHGGAGGAGGRGGAGVAHGQTGGVGGVGGVGGEADGGGLYLTAAPLTVSGGVTFATDGVSGGSGGMGGPGGQGWSANIGTRGTLKSSFGGNDGNGGAGGIGGAGQGGGLFATGSGLTISLGDAAGGVFMTKNQAGGGHGGNGQAGDVGAGAAAFYGKGTFIDGHGGNGGNGAFAKGGGVAVYGDKLVLINAALQNGIVQGGGGGTNANHYPHADSSAPYSLGYTGGGGSALGGAAGSGQGGGLYVSGSSSVTILNSTLASNSANYDSQFGDGNGGAGGNGGQNFATYYDSKMHGGNGGAGGTNQGAGLYATSSTLSFLNSTIADNAIYDSLGGAGGTGHQGNGTAGPNGSSQGSGVFAIGGSLSLTNDTIAWNFINPTTNPTPSGDAGAGIYNDASNALTMQNTIIAHDQIYNSTTTTSTTSDLSGAASALSDHNLIGDGTGSTGLVNNTNGNQVGTPTAPIDPLFSAPAPAGPGQGQVPGNYGGLTPTLPLYEYETVTSTVTSPAIAKGNPAAAATIATAEGVANATDQRGLPRLVNNAIDIGATEMQVDLSGSPSVTMVQVGGTITYMVTVTNGEGVPVNVTLSETIPTNTSYNSDAHGTGWTVPNSNSPTATATLSPGATATLTFSVIVDPGASGTLTDIANLSWTGTNTSGSSSVPMNTTVTGGISSTTTTLTSSGNPSVYGQPVTFTATVSNGSSSAPTGNVTFEDGSTPLGTGTLSGGEVRFTTSALSVGTHSITAVYGGDANDYGSANSPPVSQVVDQDNTTTTLVSSIIPSVYGQSVTFTATVAVSGLGAGTPTGTVTFYDGSTKLGTGTLSNGVATFTTSSSALAVGNDSITAVYGGDTNDKQSTSNVVTQTVAQDSTKTALTSSVEPSVYGQSVKFTATVSVVSPGAGTPTGTVTFYDGTTKLGTGTLSGGQASFTTSALSVGGHSITATYGGDTNDYGSTTSSAFSETVSQDTTATTLTSSGNTSVYGQPVTFTATVSVVSPGAGTPTGTVTFMDGNTTLGTGTLSNDVATLTTSALPGGSNSVTATYGGDTNDHGSSTTSGVSQTVNAASTTTSLTSSLTTSPLGQNVTFTATVSVVSPGSGTPAGTVDFVDTTTGRDFGPVTLSPSGTASLSVSSLTLGSNVITATYSGQTGDYLGSSASLTETTTQSILVLNSTANGALKLSGNAGIYIPGNVIVDSSAKSALSESGNAAVKATSIQVVGGVSTSGTATLSPAAVTGITAVADPLAYLTGPCTNGLTNYGAIRYSSGSYTLNPGIYSSIQASGNASLTLNPGTYIIEGGGMTVTGNASIAGSCVTIYNTSSNYPSSTGCYGGIKLSGNGSFSLTAPTSGEYAGIVIFQPSANTRAISLSGNAAAGLTGTIYAPAALLYVSGNASVNGALVVSELSLSGNAASTQTAAGTNADNAGDTAGQLLAGDVEVYVNNANGDLTSDELARIQDAVNAANTVTSPFGVTVAEVTDPTQANVTLSMGTNSAAGNYGQGVLGCYTLSGQITLIQGWNWYAGANPALIGANQYDFETTVTHELGHALGLGESNISTSAMYGTLAPLTVIRALTTADLNIPYAEAGADAQMAGPLAITPPAGAGAGNGALSGQGLSAPSSPGVPGSSGNSSSLGDQLFADLSLVLSNLRISGRPQVSAVSTLWQQADALVLHRLDALLSLEAGAMGMFNDVLLDALLFAGK
jgi:hypothetical protein